MIPEDHIILCLREQSWSRSKGELMAFVSTFDDEDRLAIQAAVMKFFSEMQELAKEKQAKALQERMEHSIRINIRP